jgi:hypothetical protein
MKKADALPDDHPDKTAIKADILERISSGDLVPCGDAKKDFEAVNAIIDETLSSEGGEGAVLIHCLASLSRSPAFILAYMMKTKRMTLVEAIGYFKSKWDACWPADGWWNCAPWPPSSPNRSRSDWGSGCCAPASTKSSRSNAAATTGSSVAAADSPA